MCFDSFENSLTITKFDERFELLNENNVIFSFLQKLKQWKDLDLDTKKAHCSILENKLCHAGFSDAEKLELFDEIELLPIFIDDSTFFMHEYNT